MTLTEALGTLDHAGADVIKRAALFRKGHPIGPHGRPFAVLPVPNDLGGLPRVDMAELNDQTGSFEILDGELSAEDSSAGDWEITGLKL